MLKFLMSRSSAYRFAVFLWRPFPVAIKAGKCFALSFGKGKERYKLLWGCGSIDVALYSKRREFPHISVIDSNSFGCSPVQSCSIISPRFYWYSSILQKQRERLISQIDSVSFNCDAIGELCAPCSDPPSGTFPLPLLRVRFYWCSSIFGKSGISEYFHYWFCIIWLWPCAKQIYRFSSLRLI